jgi:hypothetical protein
LASGSWKWVGWTVEDGAILLGGFFFGVNPWKYKWESLGPQVELEEPTYNQRYNVDIWRIKARGRWVYFAATELTPGTYGFWLPK